MTYSSVWKDMILMFKIEMNEFRNIIDANTHMYIHKYDQKILCRYTILKTIKIKFNWIQNEQNI